MIHMEQCCGWSVIMDMKITLLSNCLLAVASCLFSYLLHRRARYQHMGRISIENRIYLWNHLTLLAISDTFFLSLLFDRSLTAISLQRTCRNTFFRKEIFVSIRILPSSFDSASQTCTACWMIQQPKRIGFVMTAQPTSAGAPRTPANSHRRWRWYLLQVLVHL